MVLITFNMRQSLYFTRHGQRIDVIDKNWKNAPHRPKSIHLSPHGIAQAQALGRRLQSENVRHIFASPFYRTIETAHHIAEALDLPICVEHGVCEYLQPKFFKLGTLGVSPPEEFKDQFPRLDLSYKSLTNPLPPEDERALAARTHRAIHALLERYTDNFLIVSHGTVIRNLIWALLGGEKPELHASREGALTSVTRDGNAWRVVHNGDDAHLPSDPRFNAPSAG